MNNTELINSVAAKNGLTKKETKEILSSIIDEISKSLIDGDNVRIKSLAAFNLYTRKSSSGYNAIIGSKMEYPKKNTISFKKSKTMENYIKEGINNEQ